MVPILSLEGPHKTDTFFLRNFFNSKSVIVRAPVFDHDLIVPYGEKRDVKFSLTSLKPSHNQPENAPTIVFQSSPNVRWRDLFNDLVDEPLFREEP